MTLLAPCQWSSPFGSLLVFKGYTLVSSIYFSAQQKTSENSDIHKKKIQFSNYDMGIDIISLLHCISITSISQVYCMSLIGVSVPIHSKTWKVSVPNGNSTTPPIIKTLAQNLALISTQCYLAIHSCHPMQRDSDRCPREFRQWALITFSSLTSAHLQQSHATRVLGRHKWSVEEISDFQSHCLKFNNAWLSVRAWQRDCLSSW